MNELEVFLGLNEIDKDILMNAVHLDIKETILKALIDKMKRDHDFLISVKRCYCRHENLTAVALQTSCEKFSYNLQKRNGA